MGLGLSTKVITNNWCLFDNPDGIKNYEPGIAPSGANVRDLGNLQWDLYSQFAPIKGGKVYSNFAWWDSNSLRVNNTNENDLRASLFNLWQLPQGTCADSKAALNQAANEFRAIASLYPDGKIQKEYLGLQDPRIDFYGEMGDRAGHGMSNTMSAFIGGLDLNTVQKINDLPGRIQNLNGPEQFITKNWPSYDLAKFVIGYERGNPNPSIQTLEDGGGNNVLYVLRMAGFPSNSISISPVPTDASWKAYAIGLPQTVANSLQASFPNVLLGVGNTVSTYSCKDGLKADGIKDVSAFYGDGNKDCIQLMKDGQ